MNDLISRQAAQHKINALIDEFETIMKDIRERHVDDSVCGLCEYDGAFMSDSGNWCNECPGFERDDCFKLKDQYREEWVGSIENLPTVQLGTNLAEVGTDVPVINVGDMISRQDAIKAICEDGTWLERQGCTEITMAERKQRDADIIEDLPTVHQKQTNCEYCHTDRDGYVFPLDKNSHAFIDRDKIVLKANGWRGEAKIKYCPICGRRLTDAVD